MEALMLGKGRDCTELFESSHALSSTKPWDLLKRYEVQLDDAQLNDDPLEFNSDDLFTWEESGFYGTLKKRVKKTLEENKVTHKATWKWYLKILVLGYIYVTLFLRAFYAPHGNWLSCIFFALAAGLVAEMLHICSLHDGSHFAVAFSPLVNWLFSLTTQWFLWDWWVWCRHHVYGHHSYTGIHLKDPDLNNTKLFQRKHELGLYRSRFAVQHWTVWLWMMFLPNQHFGAAFIYCTSR